MKFLNLLVMAAMISSTASAIGQEQRNLIRADIVDDRAIQFITAIDELKGNNHFDSAQRDITSITLWAEHLKKKSQSYLGALTAHGAINFFGLNQSRWDKYQELRSGSKLWRALLNETGGQDGYGKNELKILHEIQQSLDIGDEDFDSERQEIVRDLIRVTAVQRAGKIYDASAAIECEPRQKRASQSKQNLEELIAQGHSPKAIAKLVVNNALKADETDVADH